jgi:hypothetical protein
MRFLIVLVFIPYVAAVSNSIYVENYVEPLSGLMLANNMDF